MPCKFHKSLLETGNDFEGNFFSNLKVGYNLSKCDKARRKYLVLKNKLF